MTAALSVLSASALAIALLVPLRDDRRGNRATIGGNAPLRPLFPARDRAPHEGETVPSAVSIRFGGEADANAPVEVLSRIVRDAPETTSPIGSEDSERDDPATALATTAVAEPAARGGFTFRSLAAALGFHRPAGRGPGPVEKSEPEDEAVRHETIAPEATAYDSERSFAEEVERLSEARVVSARDATVQISAMPAASEAADRTNPTSGKAIATEDVSVQHSAEAATRSNGASVRAVPDAVAHVPRADHVRETPARASVRAPEQSPSAIAPVTKNAETTEALNRGASLNADAQAPAATTPVTKDADSTEASQVGQAGARARTDDGGAEAGVAAFDAASREQTVDFARARSQAVPVPIDRMRPPLTRLPLRPKREDISWPRSLSEANADWSEEARHDFLRHAAERNEPEMERVICAAFREESTAGRLLALRALVRGSAAGTHAVFLEALRRGSDEERALAVDVFGERADREALVEALSDRLDAIAARAALACFGMSSRADLERALAPLVDRARSDAILGLLAGVLQ